jgi:vesicle coat complex subunit
VITVGAVAPLLHLIDQGEADVRKEATYAVSKLTVRGSMAQIKHLVDIGGVEVLSRLLTSQDPQVLMQALEAIDNILKSGRHAVQLEGLAENPYVHVVESYCLNQLEELQVESPDDIYNKVLLFLFELAFD